jgi:hypothetical protein
MEKKSNIDRDAPMLATHGTLYSLMHTLVEKQVLSVEDVKHITERTRSNFVGWSTETPEAKHLAESVNKLLDLSLNRFLEKYEDTNPQETPPPE